MDKKITIQYDESKLIEMIEDFNNTQIFRVNTSNTEDFINAGKQFDEICIKQAKLNPEGICRIVYVVDKIPPLSAVLKFVSAPFTEVKWGIYAVIVPPDSATLNKVIPIVSYGLGITTMQGKFAAKVFNYSHRNDLTEIMKWMDKMEGTRTPTIETKL